MTVKDNKSLVGLTIMAWPQVPTDILRYGTRAQGSGAASPRTKNLNVIQQYAKSYDNNAHRE